MASTALCIEDRRRGSVAAVTVGGLPFIGVYKGLDHWNVVVDGVLWVTASCPLTRIEQSEGLLTGGLLDVSKDTGDTGTLASCCKNVVRVWLLGPKSSVWIAGISTSETSISARHTESHERSQAYTVARPTWHKLPSSLPPAPCPSPIKLH